MRQAKDKKPRARRQKKQSGEVFDYITVIVTTYACGSCAKPVAADAQHCPHCTARFVDSACFVKRLC